MLTNPSLLHDCTTSNFAKVQETERSTLHFQEMSEAEKRRNQEHKEINSEVAAWLCPDGGWPLTRVLRLVSSWRPSSWTRWRGSPRGIPPPATWWTTASAPQMSRNWQQAKGTMHIASIGDSLVLHYLIVHVSRPQPWHDVESKQLYWEQLTGWCRNIYLNINHWSAGQVAEKTNIGQLGRKMDDQQQRQHFESWESYWGRWGLAADTCG